MKVRINTTSFYVAFYLYVEIEFSVHTIQWLALGVWGFPVDDDSVDGSRE